MDSNVVRICKVMSVTDDTDGKRIKVRLFPDDNNVTDEDLPYAFPLLPKILHVEPKVGESVLIILGQLDNGQSNRYYIGPVISQPQKMIEDPHEFSARSLLKGAIVGPETAPSVNPATEGSQPNFEDVAIIGRHASEIFLKDKEIQLRCGVHSTNNTSDLIFNKLDPSYIQMKYHEPMDNGNGNTYKSQINVVADKINLLSHQSTTQFDLTDKKELVDDEAMEDIIKRAHALPYGDLLVDFMKLLIRSYATHVHSYPGNPPIQDDTFKQVLSYNLNSILSPSIKIN